MIRPARPDDVATIVELIKELATYEREPDAVQATAVDLQAALFGEQPAVFALIAEHDEGSTPQIAGFALWFLNFSTWVGKHGIYLEDLYVKPEFRNYGYGKALLTELASIAHERGYGRLEWSVLDWNEPAHGFYRSLGAGPMGDWTVWRLHGTDLTHLGTRVGGPGGGTVKRNQRSGPLDGGPRPTD
ncbi:MAG: GNAT family N-acetyltransferase [Acidothermaceae bacterium]